MAKMLYPCIVIQKQSTNEDIRTKENRRQVWLDIQTAQKRHDLYSHSDYDYLIAIGRHDSEEVKSGTAADTIKKIKGMK